MGKFFSKFKYKAKATETTNSSAQNDNINLNDINLSNNNTSVMNGLRLVDTFCSFDSVLNVNAALGNLILIGHQNNYSLELFDFLTNKSVKSWQGHEKDITKVLYCPKIEKYLSSSRDKTVKLWSISQDKPELDLKGHDLVVTSIATDSENRYLISGSRDNNLNLWDLQTGKLVTSAYISRNLISDIFWSNDNRLLIQTGEDKEVRIWDPYNLKVIYSFPKKQYIQSSCHISRDNNYAITSSNGFQGNGCEITIWDLRQRCIIKELFGHEQTVTCAKIINNDSQIVSCSNDSTVRLWDFKNYRLIDTVFVSNALSSVAESQNQKNILVSSLSNGVHLLSK